MRSVSQLIVKQPGLERVIGGTREVKAHDLSHLTSAGWRGYDQSPISPELRWLLENTWKAAPLKGTRQAGWCHS